MRLLFIANDFPSPWLPGRGVFNEYLVRALARRHEVKVICPIPWTEEWRKERRGNPAVGCAGRADSTGPAEIFFPRYYYPPGVLRSQYGWFYWQSVKQTVRRVVESHQPEAVIGYWAHPDGAAAVRAAPMTRARSAVIVGGSDVLLITKDKSRRERVGEVLRAADAVVAVNQHLRKAVIELGVRPERAHAWSQGIDQDRFHPRDRTAARQRLDLDANQRTFVWVGRLVHVKGLDVLLRACAILHDRGRAFRVHLVGDGPLRRELEAQAAALGLGDAVRFAGSCSHESLGDWYVAADHTLLPSRSEGLPNVLRESLACGTPFIASDVGGISEIAGEGVNRLVPPEDPAALAAAMAAALDSPAPRVASLSVSWDESADAIIDIVRGPSHGAAAAPLACGACA